MIRGIYIQLHKKGSSNTTVQSYQPTEQEIRLQKQAADYSEAVAPNALKLNNEAAKLLFGNLGNTQVNYDALLTNANEQVSAAQQGVSGLTKGIIPSAYQKNFEKSIASGVENTMGTALDSLASRGVLSSSVTSKALDDISQNIADTSAQNYLNNISTLNGLYGQQASLAGQNIATSAAAQEAAQQPAINLWNASLGLNSGGTLGALSAIGNQGTTTTTSKQSGGSGLFGGIVSGLASNAGLFCFTEETKVKTPAGDKYIRHIQKADKVMAYNSKDNDTEEEVIETLKPTVQQTYAIITKDKTGKINKVFTTLSQPLMLADGEFIPLAELKINDELMNVGKITAIAYSGERKVYDLKLTGSNTYYANGFIAKGGTNEW